jgi:transcription-repair coupling factor (superfamily II helicase)
MHDNGTAVKLQPDHKLVFRAEWEDGVERLRATRSLVRELADIAEHKEPALPQTTSGEAMPRLNIGKMKTQAPPVAVKKAHAPIVPNVFRHGPRGFGKQGK